MSNPIIGGHVSSSGGIFSSVERGENIEAEAIQIFCSAPQMWRASTVLLANTMVTQMLRRHVMTAPLDHTQM